MIDQVRWQSLESENQCRQGPGLDIVSLDWPAENPFEIDIIMSSSRNDN